MEVLIFQSYPTVRQPSNAPLSLQSNVKISIRFKYVLKFRILVLYKEVLIF
jgi:hypothetical protein